MLRWIRVCLWIGMIALGMAMPSFAEPLHTPSQWLDILVTQEASEAQAADHRKLLLGAAVANHGDFRGQTIYQTALSSEQKEAVALYRGFMKEHGDQLYTQWFAGALLADDEKYASIFHAQCCVRYFEARVKPGWQDRNAPLSSAEEEYTQGRFILTGTNMRRWGNCRWARRRISCYVAWICSRKN